MIAGSFFGCRTSVCNHRATRRVQSNVHLHLIDCALESTPKVLLYSISGGPKSVAFAGRCRYSPESDTPQRNCGSPGKIQAFKKWRVWLLPPQFQFAISAFLYANAAVLLCLIDIPTIYLGQHILSCGVGRTPEILLRSTRRSCDLPARWVYILLISVSRRLAASHAFATAQPGAAISGAATRRQQHADLTTTSACPARQRLYGSLCGDHVVHGSRDAEPGRAPT